MAVALNKNNPWDGATGEQVETFIKRALERRIGIIWKDEETGVSYYFADDDNRKLYFADPVTYADLLLGSSAGNNNGDVGGDPDEPTGTLVVLGADTLSEGESSQYETEPYDPRVGWSIESGAEDGDSINAATGMLTTAVVNKKRKIVIKAEYNAAIGRKTVTVFPVVLEDPDYPEDIIISGNNEVVEGDESFYEASNSESVWSIVSGADTGDELSSTSGALTSLRTAIVGKNRNIVIQATADDLVGAKSIAVKKAVYPTEGIISGAGYVFRETEFQLNLMQNGVSIEPSAINKSYNVGWSIEGGSAVSIKSSNKQSCTLALSDTVSESFKLKAIISVSDITSFTVEKDINKGESPSNEDCITIDQSNTDVVITPDYNAQQVYNIWLQSERYLGKYYLGKMHICPLLRSNSTKYADGSDADLSGAQGDVYMRLPKFYYRAEQVTSDVYKIYFRCNANPPADDDLVNWKVWDGNDLIGVYKAYSDGTKLRSISGQANTVGLSYNDFKTLASNRGTGFSLVKWEHHSMMAFLYLAKYANVNSQLVIGDGIQAYEYESGGEAGQNNLMGMTDTTPAKGKDKPVNFWGLEGWWGGTYEFIDNVIVRPADNSWDITNDYGEVVRSYSGLPDKGFISKLGISDGEILTVVPIEVNGTSETGYCDNYGALNNSNGALARSGIANYAQCGIFAVEQRGGFDYTNGYNSTRLAFRGSIIEAQSTESFEAIESWS